MFHSPSGAVIRQTAFRDKAVDVRIPFKGTSEGVKNTNEAGDKVFGFVYVVKHPQENTADSLKEAVKERAVFEKEAAEFFINGKNTVPVYTMNEFKGHRSRACL